MDRRDFVRDAASNALSLLGTEVFASEAPKYRPTGEILVTVFLRGACDGLNLVPPHSGKDRELYESARPNVQISAQELLKLDDRFGLHPSAKALYPHYQGGKLAVIHSAGLPSDSRSHFDAQAFMDLGTPGKKNTTSGWLARHLAGARETRAASPIQALGIGAFLPLSLMGYDRCAELENPGTFTILGSPQMAQSYFRALRRMYSGEGWLSRSAGDALDAWEAIGAVAEKAKAAGPGDYPKGEIGNRLHATALLLKAGLGVRAAAIDMGGWDTHKYQGQNQDGTFANQVSQLSESLSAFMKEMAGQTVTVLVMSEFGRRVRENASRGTDHGHGSVMLALGEGVRGGRVYGDWAGLATERLYDRADLAVTTDYRQVLTEALAHRMGDSRTSVVFPGFKSAKRELGIFAKT